MITVISNMAMFGRSGVTSDSMLKYPRLVGLTCGQNWMFNPFSPLTVCTCVACVCMAASSPIAISKPRGNRNRSMQLWTLHGCSNNLQDKPTACISFSSTK